MKIKLKQIKFNKHKKRVRLATKKTSNKKLFNERKKQRKNYLPALIISIVLWLSIFYTLYHIDPNSFAVILFFLIQLFLALLFTFSLLLASIRRGLLIAGGSVFFLLLKYIGVGNVLNFILIFSIIIVIEAFYHQANNS